MTWRAIFFLILFIYPIYSQDVMKGFPPPPGQIVTDKNWEEPPFSRWAFFHTRRILPSADVDKGTKAPKPLPEAFADLSSVTVKDLNGKNLSLKEALKTTFTDAFLVIKDGKIVAEIGDTRQPHILWSGTKSFVGLLAEMAAKEGKLELNKTVSFYVPELAGSGYGDATIQQVLDMQIVPDQERLTVPSEYTPDEFLPSVKKARPHGEVFFYTSMTTDVLAWVLERATGQYLPDYLSQNIWQKIGAEENGYFLVDRKGRAKAGGGFNSTARDFGRFGLAILDGSILSPSFYAGDSAPFENSTFAIAMPEGGYHNQWWKLNGNEGPFLAIGVYGQYLWIDPKEKLIMVKFSSEPKPADLEYSFLTMSIFEAIKGQL